MLCSGGYTALAVRVCALPLEGALHLLLLLVGLLDLVGDPGQELLKIGQEVRLVSPELGPETAHLVCPGEREGGGVNHMSGTDYGRQTTDSQVQKTPENRRDHTHSSNTLLAPRLSSSMQKCLSSSSSTPDSLASHWL